MCWCSSTNIFRFVQAGAEVSALLGTHALRRRLPAHSRQLRWVSLQERITSTKRGSITSGASHLCACRRPDRPGASPRPSRTWTPMCI